MALGSVHGESLDVRIAFVVGIIENGSPYLMLVPLFQSQDIVLVVVVGVEVGDIELAIVENHQDIFIVIKLAEETSVLVVIDTVDIRIEPHLSSSQGTVSMTLQTNATDGSPGEQIALGGTSLDDNIREVFLDKDALSLLREVWIQCYLDDFSLAVGVGREVDDTASGRSLRDVEGCSFPRRSCRPPWSP